MEPSSAVTTFGSCANRGTTVSTMRNGPIGLSATARTTATMATQLIEHTAFGKAQRTGGDETSRRTFTVGAPLRDAAASKHRSCKHMPGTVVIVILHDRATPGAQNTASFN